MHICVHPLYPRKGIKREDGYLWEAACIHMYLGHPTDNVQIESLKKYDAEKRSRSWTTEEPIS